ncbi:MAG: DUF58 domain-containing protein [Planctomycetota bacterium]|jgi:uncharacterized protein (DUF58 family)
MAGPLFSEEFLRKIERLSLVARRDQGAGAVRPDRRGGRHEFADHRPYSPGDDLRYVDWHLYGRFGRLFLKEFAREEEAEVLLVLDTSASMGEKLRGALRLSAALLTIALANGDRVRFATAADGVLSVGLTLESAGRRSDLLNQIAALDGQAEGETDLDRSLRLLPPRRGPGRRLTLLVSDLLAEADGRRAMARLGADAAVFHWLSREDRAPDARGRVRLVSAEGGELVAFVGEEACARYAREMEAHQEGLRSFFGRAGVRYLVTPAERPVTDLVLRVLTEEGVLG